MKKTEEKETTLYMVQQMIKISALETESGIPLSTSIEGLIGFLPIFDTRATAEKYRDDNPTNERGLSDILLLKTPGEIK